MEIQRFPEVIRRLLWLRHPLVTEDAYHMHHDVAEVLQKVQRIPPYISRCESYMQKSAGAQQSCSK